MNFTSLYKLLLIAGLALLSIGAFAAEPVAKSDEGIAIGGRDSVTYHSLERSPQDKAVAGVESYVVEWKGATWQFGSKKSADLFKADPERYSPAYNGHCANALSLDRGLLVTDGTHWEIFGEQLYLFYAARGRDRWINADDITPFVAAANSAWENILKNQ